MNFTIITPTCNRSNKLANAIDSVIAQTNANWQMIVINDSPADASYGIIEEKIKNNEQIVYIKNIENAGVNFSRNRALDVAAEKSITDSWIIFLDDDDVLAEDALAVYETVHATHPNENWLLTNRAYYDGTPLTFIQRSDKNYSYISGFLLTKRLKGDATHCIKRETIDNIRFPRYVTQGEEWLFYYQLSLKLKTFFYHDHNSTLSSGYPSDGLNFRKRTRSEKIKTLASLVRESVERNIIWHPTLLMYFSARFFLVIWK